MNSQGKDWDAIALYGEERTVAEKKTVSVKDVVADIKACMTDDQLMVKLEALLAPAEAPRV